MPIVAHWHLQLKSRVHLSPFELPPLPCLRIKGRLEGCSVVATVEVVNVIKIPKWNTKYIYNAVISKIIRSLHRSIIPKSISKFKSENFHNKIDWQCNTNSRTLRLIPVFITQSTQLRVPSKLSLSRVTCN